LLVKDATDKDAIPVCEMAYLHIDGILPDFPAKETGKGCRM
jgi:hypothetical protein